MIFQDGYCTTNQILTTLGDPPKKHLPGTAAPQVA
jgi:hypothetical protein